MSEILKLRTKSEIEEEAAVWTWRMDSDSVSAADRSAFESWLRRDVRHRRAYEELSQVWSGLDGLAEAKRDEKIAAFASTRLGADAGDRAAWRWPAMAAALLALAIGATLVLQRGGGETQTFATAVGQQRRVTLSDGSVVALNTNTIVEANLQRGVRDLTLRQGEAHFQVAHDRSRPFFVHAADTVVRAVGTEFEVRLRNDRRVDVVVNEGRVEVQDAPLDARSADGVPKPRHHTQALGAGEHLSASGAAYAIMPVSTHELSSVLAWREGAVVFDADSLGDAIAEVGRYTDVRIVVSDPQLSTLRVGGRFRTGDLEGFFSALQTALPVSIRRAPDGVIFIDPRR